MINLDVYSFKTIQEISSLLDSYMNKGYFLISNIQDDLNIIISRRVTDIINQSEKVAPIELKQVQFLECPSCIKGHMRPVINDSKLNIWGCSRCRYSQIMEVDYGK